MSDKGRSLNIFLLICALLGGVIFYGCSTGGGNSSDTIELQITGQVTSPVSFAESLRGASYVASNTYVYLENYPNISGYTDSTGKYLLSGVPAGNHNVIAKFVLGGKVYKMRSQSIIVSSDNNPAVSETIETKEAAASFTVRLLDKNDKPVENGKVTVWGETVYTDANGYCQTPPLPLGASATIYLTGSTAAYQTTNTTVQFNNQPVTLVNTVVETTQSNLPPTASIQANSEVYKSGVLALSGIYNSRQGFEQISSFWTAEIASSSDIGSFTSQSLDKAVWKAPAIDCIATLTYKVVDINGQSAQASIRVTVGSGKIDTNRAPVISDITSSVTPITSLARVILTGNASDPDGDSLKYTWTVTDGSVSPSQATGIATTTWTAPQTSTGATERVTLTVSDGKLAASFTRSFDIGIDPEEANNATPTANIASPSDNDLFAAGERISLRANAVDPEGHDMTYRWTWAIRGSSDIFSDIVDGEISTFTPTISATYTLYLEVEDNYGAIGTDSVTFRVNADPKAEIVVNPVGTSFSIGQQLTFTASATDIEDGTNLDYAWYYNDEADVYSTASSFDVTLPSGGHTFTLSVKDSKGGMATATKNITVTNRGPVMSIDEPVSIYLAAGRENTFKGTWITYGGTTVASDTMVWKDTSGNELGTGDTLTCSISTVGSYTLRLEGEDSDGVASYTDRTFLVCATPSVTITSPSTTEFVRYDSGSDITFTASNITKTSGDGLTLTWYSNLDANGAVGDTVIGTGESFTKNDLASGVHNIWCIASSSANGLASCSQIASFIVNTLPVATISFATDQYATGPNDIPILLCTTLAAEIDFAVSTYDEEINGPLPGDSICWYLNSDFTQRVATGSSYDNVALPVGISTLTVRLYDSLAEQEGGKYRDYASSTYEFAVQILQSRSHSFGTDVFPSGANPVDMTSVDDGKAPNLRLTFDQTGLEEQYRVFKFNGDGTMSTDYLASGEAAITASSTDVRPFTSLLTGAGAPDKALVLGSDGSDQYIKRFITVNDAEIASITSTIGLIHMAINGDTGDVAYMCDSKHIYTARYNNLADVSAVLTKCGNTVFSDLVKIRYTGAEKVGRVLVVDKDGKKVFRYTNDDLSTPLKEITVTDDKPVDVACSDSYVFVLKSNDVIDVYDTGANFVTSFGGSTTDISEKGKFYGPKAIYCSGYDLFILESGSGAGNGRLQVIRANKADFFKD